MNEQETPAPEMLKRHPYCQIWPEYDITDLASDIAERGQDQATLLYEGMVLDGWHRYLSALKAGRTPTVEEFQGTPLEAAEKVHAANNIRRHMTPEQRYACFLLLCKQVPEFGAKYEAMKAEAEARIAAGQPLATGSQRLNVVAAKAADVGVSPATAKKVERAVKNDPEALDRLAKGKTTANKELGKKKGKSRSATDSSTTGTGSDTAHHQEANGQQPRKELEVVPGDLLYEVERYKWGEAGSPKLMEFEVGKVDTHSYVTATSKRVHKPDAFTLEEAKAERIERLQKEIADLEEELRGLKASVKNEPTIVAAVKKQGSEAP